MRKHCLTYRRQPNRTFFFLVRNVSTAFCSSSSMEMNWNFAGSSDSTSWLRCGRLATQGEHQVAQNSSTTTLPFRLAQSALAPKGACSSFRESKGGAGVPFSGCAHSEAVPSKTAKRAIRLPREATRMCTRSNIRCISPSPNESQNPHCVRIRNRETAGAARSDRKL